MGKTLEELIAFLEQHGSGCGLISDDAGHWVVATEGMQNVPENPPEDIDSRFFVTAEEWKPSVREALEAFHEKVLAESDSDNTV